MKEYKPLSALKESIIFAVLVILVLIPCIFSLTDSQPTINTLTLGAVLLAFSIVLVYCTLRWILKHFNLHYSSLLNALFLYLLAELIIVCFTGNLSFFGLFIDSTDPRFALYPDTYDYRIKTEFSLSASLAFASVVVLIINLVQKRKLDNQAALPH